MQTLRAQTSPCKLVCIACNSNDCHNEYKKSFDNNNNYKNYNNNNNSIKNDASGPRARHNAPHVYLSTHFAVITRGNLRDVDHQRIRRTTHSPNLVDKSSHATRIAAARPSNV